MLSLASSTSYELTPAFEEWSGSKRSRNRKQGLLGKMEMGKIELEGTQYTYPEFFVNCPFSHFGQIVLASGQESFVHIRN